MFQDPMSSSPFDNAVASSIKRQSVPITTLDPRAPLDDLIPLQQVVRNVSIVGLGEASHGAHEFFVMKHRLFEFLVEHMGFTMLAMEMEWTSAALINEYVLTGQGNAKALLQDTAYKLWQTQEVLDMIEWMRTYNADPAHQRKVHFAGFDCIAMQGAHLEKILQFFQRVDPKRSQEVASFYQDIPRSARARRPEQAVLQRNVEGARHVSELLKEHELEYSQRSSSESWFQIVQAARIVEQVTLQKAGYANTRLNEPKWMQTYQQRDYFMAENIKWLHEHAEGGRKMVLWAHNWHIGALGQWCCDPYGNNGPFTWMGILLRAGYQQQYMAVGFSFFEGSLNAHPVDAEGKYLSHEWQPFAVKPAKAGSYEAVFAKAGNHYLLDMRSVSGEANTWLRGPRPFRLFDSDYCSNESRFYHTASLPAWYDVIIHIQTISPSRMFV